MKILVLGSTGKTGYQVVKQLLKNDFQVKAVARKGDKFHDIMHNKNLEIIIESILEIDSARMKEILLDVDAVISCLGHNITLRGIFGKPHYLVTESIIKVVKNINPDQMKKLILMSTTACLKSSSSEMFSLGEKMVMAVMRALLPPQRDSEKALEYIEKNTVLENSWEWIAVRPDTLIEEESVTEYTVYETAQRSPVFNAGKTSRCNVAHFMKELLSKEELWNTWKYKAPVIYNGE